MCQAYEAESNYIMARDARERRRKWEAHKSGETPLPDEEIRTVYIEALMDSEG